MTRWPTRDLRALLRRQCEIDVEHRQIGQGHDRRAGIEILPEIDLADAEPAGKRGADQLLRDDGLSFLDFGIGLVELALVLVDGLLRRELALDQLLGARQRDYREFRLRLVIGEVAAIRRVVQLDQRVAGLHRLSRLEEDLGDEPGHLGIDRDLVDRGQRADAGGKARDRLGLGDDGADLRRRRLVVGEEVGDRVLAKAVEAVEPAEHERPAAARR